jgi:uncharacterized membrane protein YeaQ/YmgE (transglycosylase-associated protein family)
MDMVGMNFASFLTLLIISFVVALVVHYAIRYRILDGFDGFLAKWIVGWVGAWVASPVLGHWFSGMVIAGVYVIPAVIGGLVGAFAPAALWKARTTALTPHVVEVQKTQTAA